MEKYSARGFKIAFNKRKIINNILTTQDEYTNSSYYLFQCNRNIDEYDRRHFVINRDKYHIISYTEENIFKNLDCLSPGFYDCEDCIFKNILSSHFHIKSGLNRGPRHELIVFNDPIKKDVKATNKISKRLKILCHIPKYIKMELLEDTTEMTFWELYNLI